MGDLFNTIIGPIEWLVAWIMYGFHQALHVHRDEPGLGVDLGPVDRRPRHRHAGPRDPAVRQADQGLAQDADDPARDAEDPEEVQGQDRPRVPPGDDPGDDGALQAGRGPTRFSSCLPILLQSPFFFGAVPGAQQPGRDRLRRAQARSGRSPSRSRQQFEQATIFGAPLSVDVHAGPQHGDRQDRHGRADHPDVGHDVHHPAPADDEEHAGLGAGQPLRQAAEDPALPAAALLRDLRHQLPDRCPDLLAHHQPVVDGPAVLRHPPDAGARLRGREGLPRAARAQGQADSRGCRRRGQGGRRGGGGRRAGQAVGPAPAAQGKKRKKSKAAGCQAGRPGRPTARSAMPGHAEPCRTRPRRRARRTARRRPGRRPEAERTRGRPARTPPARPSPPRPDPPDAGEPP